MSPAKALVTSEHWVPSSDAHELHVRRLQPPSAGPGAPAVLFLAGQFTDAGLFLSRSGQGPARTFTEAGFVAYLASLRGHGASRRPGRRRYDWNFDTYVRHDLPDLIRETAHRHDGPLFVLAHSMAGYATLAALGVDPTLQELLTGVVTLSSAVNDYTDGGLSKRFGLTAAPVLAGLLGRFPARALRQGRWDEPAGLMRQFAQWAPTGAFRSADARTDYWQALGQVRLPVLVGVGAADRFHASPGRARKLADHLGGPVEYVVFGRETGLSWEPGHFDVLRGSRADAEVLPRVIAWLRRPEGR
jgi:predicted alpha/beta hydrolase